MFLTGRLAEFPRVGELIEEICDFRVRINQIPRGVSRHDQRFIESAIAGNMIEIQTLQYTLERTTDEELRGLLQMMIVMHESDLEMALEVAEKIGADQTPDLTNARVYPQTPLYDLGERRVNLVARFLDPLMAGSDGTVTPIPTTATAGATGTGTVLPPGTPTGTSTLPPVPSGTATPFGTGTGTVTPGTATAVGTGTGTVMPTGTGTAIPTGTETAAVTATTTLTALTATTTGTAVATTTGTAIVTETGTAVPTGTGTLVPTVIPPTRPDFVMLALHVIEDEHGMSVETALVAQRLAKNREIRAFAKHAADVAKLHMLLLDDLQYRLAHDITLPEPEFEEDYQSPRRLEPSASEADD